MNQELVYRCCDCQELEHSTETLFTKPVTGNLVTPCVDCGCITYLAQHGISADYLEALKSFTDFIDTSVDDLREALSINNKEILEHLIDIIFLNIDALNEAFKEIDKEIDYNVALRRLRIPESEFQYPDE